MRIGRALIVFVNSIACYEAISHLTIYTLLCKWIFEPSEIITMYVVYRDNISWIIMYIYIAINPFQADKTLACSWRFEHAKQITIHVVPIYIFLEFSRFSEANASTLVEYLEEMFPRYL